MADQNMHWDGQQWLHWNGQQWTPVAGQTVTQPHYIPPPTPPPYAVPPTPVPYGAPGTYAAAASVPMVHQQPPRVLTDQSSKGGQTAIAWILAVFTLGYFLPWAIAATRGKSNAGMIGLLNLLIGWSLIGWIVALVMACSPHQTAVAYS